MTSTNSLQTGMALPPDSPAHGPVAVDGGTLHHRTMKIHWPEDLASSAREAEAIVPLAGQCHEGQRQGAGAGSCPLQMARGARTGVSGRDDPALPAARRTPARS